MIYEKRYGADKAKINNPSDAYALENGVSYKEEKTICTENKSRTKDVRDKGTGYGARKRRRHPFGRLSSCLAVMCVVFGILYADARLFDSALLFKAIKITEAIATAVSQNEKPAEEPVTHSRTLYTLEYSEIVSEEPSLIYATYEDTEDTEDTVQTSVSAVPVIQGYADGERLLPITELNLSSEGLLSIKNETTFSPDVKKLSQMRPSVLDDISETEGPLVLVLHTHACESYTQYETAYPENEQTRSTDTSQNVIAVGEEICNTLSDFGVSAIHCTLLHDSESFINAYSNSASSVKSYLEKYPSIRFVVDVHRDAIIRDDGESIKAVAEISGEKYAQLMFVVGTNQLGHNHPDWQNNLSLALTLQQSIDSTYPSLCRSINLRNVPFNQQLSEGYLLLEVGTSANTMEEALRSARAFGENLARVILTA